MAPSWGVSANKEAELQRRLEALGVEDRHLEERFMRARGPGGQKVNKTAVAVSLKHLPSGIEVRVERTRSQALNRFLARRKLVERLEEALGQISKEQKRCQKLRKQKQKRRKRALAKKTDGAGGNEGSDEF